jgi:hypothetical protein
MGSGVAVGAAVVESVLVEVVVVVVSEGLVLAVVCVVESDTDVDVCNRVIPQNATRTNVMMVPKGGHEC